MKTLNRISPLFLSAGLLFTLNACASNPGSASDSAEGRAAAVHTASLSDETRNQAKAGEEKTQSFSNVTNLTVTGYLQHIEIGTSNSSDLVIRWTGDGSETMSQKGGVVALKMPEPDWLDKNLPNDGPRFSVTSTIYVELPDSIDTASFTTTLGDITIDSVTAYNHLTAETILGNLTVSGLVGKITAETGRGSIGPDSFAADITEQPYSTETTSKKLETTIPGGFNPPQKAKLYSESGIIMINEPSQDAS